MDDFAASLSDQTPAVPTSTTTAATTTTTTTTTSSCPTATSVTITFNALATTIYGETLYITGSIPQLGNWDTAGNARIGLRADKYTTDTNLWYLPVELPAATSFEYKYYRVDSDNQVTWESGDNRGYTVPVGCDGSASVDDSWR